MKVPVCECGHTLAEHRNDDGKAWQRAGFCINGYFEGQKFLGYGTGCPCPEFRWKPKKVAA